MLSRIAIIVLFVLAGARCAEAGMISKMGGGQMAISSVAAADVLADSINLQGQDENSRYLQDGGETDLTGFALTSVQPIGVHALLSSDSPPLSSPSPLWQVALDNAMLPPSPLLDGLLKPA